MAKVEFVKYVNNSEMLCAGVFYVKINGKLISFNAWNNKVDYPPFWECEGGFGCTAEKEEDLPKGPWHIPYDLDLTPYTDEDQKIVNGILKKVEVAENTAQKWEAKIRHLKGRVNAIKRKL